MSEPTKDALLSILQQRMDKCTNEQFWAVASLSALYAALIAHTDILSPGIPRWVTAIALSAAAFYGVFFVMHRHKAYYNYRKDFSELVKDSPITPSFMKEIRSPWELPRLTGLIFYSLWIIGGYAVTMYVILKLCA